MFHLCSTKVKGLCKQEGSEAAGPGRKLPWSPGDVVTGMQKMDRGLMGCDWGDMEGKGEPGLGTWVAGEPLDEMKCGRADTDLGIYDKLELDR